MGLEWALEELHSDRYIPAALTQGTDDGELVLVVVVTVVGLADEDVAAIGDAADCPIQGLVVRRVHGEGLAADHGGRARPPHPQGVAAAGGDEARGQSPVIRVAPIPRWTRSLIRGHSWRCVIRVSAVWDG